MKGSAELDDCYDALFGAEVKLDEEIAKTLDEYSTIGGLLCSLAGEIPTTGQKINFGGFCFNITEVYEYLLPTCHLILTMSFSTFCRLMRGEYCLLMPRR